MRTRGAAIQGGLAAFGLIFAYTTWQRQPEKPAGEAIVLDAGKNDLVKIRFEDKTKPDAPKWVELEPGKDADGPLAWVKTSANPTLKAPERTVRGNDAALKLVEKFTPLRATRALGVLAPEKLKELGLDTPKKTLEVTTRSGKVTFSVASSAFNVSDPYVIDDSKKVYVLGGGILSDLDSAAVRFTDRALHTWKQPDFDAFTVTTGGKSRELLQKTAETPATAKVVSKKTDKPDEMAKNWHDKIWRTYAVEILGKDEKPEGELTPVLKIDYLQKGKSRGYLEIVRGPGPPPPAAAAPTSQPPSTVLYARSEHTIGWVKLPLTVDEALKEADKIVAGE